MYDHDSGYYYLQSRYYDPEVGRFINSDIYTCNGQGQLGNNSFIYCENNPASKKDDNGEFGVVALCVIGGFVSGAIEYASQVIKNYRDGESGIDAWTKNLDYGEIAASAFSGAISAIPGGGFVATAADIVGSAAIKQGVNCIVKKQDWSWEEFGGDVLSNAESAYISSKFKMADDVPQYIRHIKDEARDMGIKGTKKLTKYLNFKQVSVIVINGFTNDTIGELVELN